ncbi:MAG: hypothetical protein ACJA06_002345 [Halocynthiibacter sp.]|jgi:uncharacterized protein
MEFTEMSFPEATPIEGYGPGFFRVGGAVHHGPVLVTKAKIVRWGGFEDAATLAALADELDILFIGTGAEIAPLPRAFREALEAVGLGAEPMASPTACRTYNVLLYEGRRVGAALLPV